jgi:hypothetical protein
MRGDDDDDEIAKDGSECVEIFADMHVDYEIRHGDEVFLPLADSNSQHYIYLVLRPCSPIAPTVTKELVLARLSCQACQGTRR